MIRELLCSVMPSPKSVVVGSCSWSLWTFSMDIDTKIPTYKKKINKFTLIPNIYNFAA
jgi:hypothetical protein